MGEYVSFLSNLDKLVEKENVRGDKTTMSLTKKEAQALAKKIIDHSKDYGIPLKKKKKNK